MAFGQELQLERERRSVTLGFIADVTKVPQRHLHALELEQFEQLPGGIFTKGIVRSYCRTLGLDEEEWLRKIPEAIPDEPGPAWAEFAENVSRARVISSPRMPWRWWGVLMMAMSLGALGWGAWHYVIQPQVGLTPPARSSRWPDRLLHRGPHSAPAVETHDQDHELSRQTRLPTGSLGVPTGFRAVGFGGGTVSR